MIVHPVEIFRAHRHRQRRKALLGSLNFGNGDREFYLVSFPRSGNTWVRIMMAYLISEEEEIAFHNVGNYIPDTDQRKQLDAITDHNSCFNQLPVQVVKSHDYFNQFYRDKKVIYVVREGLDVITSYFHYVNARTDIPFPQKAFVEGNTAKIKCWCRHLLGWYKAQSERQLVVKYEDIISDPICQLRRVANFLGVDSTQEDLSDAVAKSDFVRMKRLEDKYGYFKDNRTAKGKNSPFVREGKVRGNNDVFDNVQIERFHRRSAKIAKMYGY